MLLPALLLALAAAPQTAAKPATPEKPVCKRIEKTGSRLGSKKICLTRAEWEERTRNDQREYNNMLKQAEACKRDC
jgi:hypothetical protein